VVYDQRGDEIWDFRPATRDLPSCQRMVNALYALARKTPPRAQT
jgi:hypothetical protein